MLSIFPNTFSDPSFARLADRLDRFFETTGLGDRMAPEPMAAPWPSVNVWTEGDNIEFEAETPGLRMQDVEVLATEDTLTIRGQRVTVTPENGMALRLERPAGHFERTLRLPAPIDPDGVEARMVNGVLRITMPLAQEARPRRVRVKALDAGAAPAEPAGAAAG